MQKSITLPAWLLVATLFSQVLLLALNGHLLYQQHTARKSWTLDSTTYYTYWEAQGRLNLNLYNRQQAHEERLGRLEKKRQFQYGILRRRSVALTVILPDRQAALRKRARTYIDMIRWHGYQYPDVAAAISAIETGWWQPAWTNNLFGMKRSSRQFNQGATRAGYCIYVNEKLSLNDYAAYERHAIKKYSLNTQAQYIDHICRRYCRDPHYRVKLNRALALINQLDNEVGNPT